MAKATKTAEQATITDADNQVPVLKAVSDLGTVLLKRYDLPDATIAALKADYGKLTIAGPDDKETYKTATAALTRVRGLRTGVEAKRKELKQPFWDAGVSIDNEAKRLTNELTPIETHLAAQIKATDDEAERRRKAEEVRRVNLLNDAGFTLVGQNYVAGKIVLPWDEIVKMDAQLLDDNIAAGKVQLENIAAEAKRQKEAADKLANERAELEKLRQQLADKEAELNAKLAPAPQEVPVRDWMDSGGDGLHLPASQPGVPFDEQLPPVVDQPVVSRPAAPVRLPSVNSATPRTAPYTMKDAYDDGFDSGIESICTLFLADATPRKRTEWVEVFRKLKKRQ